MPILVKFFSILRAHAGTGEYTPENPNLSTLRDVLIDVDQRFFEGTALIFEIRPSNVNPALLLLVDDHDYRLLDGELDYTLAGNEEITLLSSVHGG
ncbi:MAG TPA: MoaD/ThiS family protein [Candidatus Lokiarchaeia archaeon]|nr:MoaD/ThiS family protein [Candidatus Lokiarchaeia archaeon]